jgi:hypothetical protein
VETARVAITKGFVLPQFAPFAVDADGSRLSPTLLPPTFYDPVRLIYGVLVGS